MITDVLFRKGRGGEVFALFPGLPGTSEAHTCTCFLHIGQHGYANLRMCVRTTRPATPDEYADLKRELESRPYEYQLRVMKRSTRKHYQERVEQL